MKLKLYALVILINLQLACLAQSPTIGIENFFNADTNYIRRGYAPSFEKINLLTGIIGENQIWDLQPLANEFIYEYDTLRIIPTPSSYSYYSDYYDTSNILVQIKNGADQYFFNFIKQTDTVFYVGGGAFGTQGYPEAIFQRFKGRFLSELFNNTTFGTSILEKFEGEWYDGSGSDEHYIKNGTVIMIADSYGKLIYTNGDTLRDILRIKRIISYVDSNYIFGVQNHSDTLYSWYSSNYSSPILNIRAGSFILNNQLFGLNSVTVYEINNSHVVTNPEIISNPYSMNIYTTNNAITINIDNLGTSTISASIFDVLGRRITTIPVQSGLNSIGCSGYSGGVYLIVLKSESKILKVSKIKIENN